MPSIRRSLIIVLPLLLCTVTLVARVVRVEVAERHAVANGTPYGLAGDYEAIRGKLYFAADPANPANSTIADLSLASRNAAGLVEFAADFHIIRPRELSRGNGVVLCEISNRGGKGMLGHFNSAKSSADPRTADEFGDGFLLKRGYTLLWVGWQFDVPHEAGRMRGYVPVARNADGSPVTGVTRANIIVGDTTFSRPLADRGHIPYEAAAPDDARNVLMVRERPGSPPVVIPRSKWRFARWENGAARPDGGSVFLEGGFQPNRIYDLTYVVENPPVAGLGLAAIRDVVSYLKHTDDSLLGVKSGQISRAYSFGVSQSGRFLRAFLHDGFNGDEAGRRVFDGVMAHVAGGGRGGFNVRFAQPSRDGHPFMNLYYPTDIFPFTDGVQRDPVTGWEDGILARYAGREDLKPKTFYTNSSYEYWGRAASLTHTTLDGTRDFPPDPNTRIYQFAGTQHGTGSWPPARSGTAEFVNPNRIRPGMRALLVALDAWVRDGVEPPASRYSRIDAGTLVRAEAFNFPALPGRDLAPVKRTSALEQAWRADYGPRFRAERIIDKDPPALGQPFPVLIPQVDADGNERDGIRLPDIAAPLATYTGWNLFDGKSGPADVLSSMQGSFIPFPRTRAEAEQTGDPRQPVEARYRSREEYLGRVAQSCMKLTRERLLLPEDIPDILEHSGEVWDWIWKNER